MESVPYTVVMYALYFFQLALTSVAVCVIIKQDRKNASIRAVCWPGVASVLMCVALKTSNDSSNLVRILMFAVGPCLLQIPFAIQQTCRVLRRANE